MKNNERLETFAGLSLAALALTSCTNSTNQPVVPPPSASHAPAACEAHVIANRDDLEHRQLAVGEISLRGSGKVTGFTVNWGDFGGNDTLHQEGNGRYQLTYHAYELPAKLPTDYEIQVTADVSGGKTSQEDCTPIDLVIDRAGQIQIG